MSFSDVINVVISRSAPAITLPGFGILLIATPYPTWTERTRTYDDSDDVESDFPDTTAEWACANQAFSQNPAPESLMFGRMANKPTKVQVIGITTVSDTSTYSVRVWVAGTLQTASYVAQPSDTNDLIVAGLLAAVNALAAPSLNFTAASSGSSGSHVMTCTGTAAGDYFAVEVMDLNLMSSLDTTADAGIVADVTAIAAESVAWYGLCLIYKSNAISLAAAGWVESNTKLFVMASSDSAIATHALAGASDVLANLLQAARARTAGAYHPRDYEFFDASELGRWFPILPGQDNWRMKTLSGVTPGIGVGFAALTTTQTGNIEAKNGNYYYTIAPGTNVVQGGGKVASGDYIDNVRGIDWWTATLSGDVVQLEIDEEKIPFTDAGVGLIKNAVRRVNKLGISQGLINPIPKPTVTAPLVADIDPTDKANRNLPDVDTEWVLAGAINASTVNATITD